MKRTIIAAAAILAATTAQAQISQLCLANRRCAEQAARTAPRDAMIRQEAVDKKQSAQGEQAAREARWTEEVRTGKGDYGPVNLNDRPPSDGSEMLGCTSAPASQQCASLKLEMAARRAVFFAKQAALRAEEKARRQREQQRIKEQNAAVQELQRLEATPPVRLYNAYRLYGYIQACHQEREGYAAVWINDVELARAEKAIKAIKAQAIADMPELGPTNDQVWEKSLQSLQGQRLFPELCQRSLQQLYGLSPVAAHTIVKP